jgi:hypothetical protein
MITQENVYSFYVNGFIHGNIEQIKTINPDDFYFDDCVKTKNKTKTIDKNIMPVLKNTCQYLIDNYVSILFHDYEVLEKYCWSGVDDYSKHWHNDSKENFNSNILVYLDDSLEKNSIEIKNGSNEIFTVYFKAGDFVWLNQNLQFSHRANHIVSNRRVLSYHFNIRDLHGLNN